MLEISALRVRMRSRGLPVMYSSSIFYKISLISVLLLKKSKTKLSGEQGGGKCNSYDRELISHTNSYKSIGK